MGLTRPVYVINTHERQTRRRTRRIAGVVYHVETAYTYSARDKISSAAGKTRVKA